MKVKDLLSTEDKWTKRHAARNKLSVPVQVHDLTAVKFCLMGALDKCYLGGSPDVNAYLKAYNTLNRVILNTKGKSIITFNDDDNTTFEDIKRVLEDTGI
jgi:hypothetical protein